jgi:hypothetical protein
VTTKASATKSQASEDLMKLGKLERDPVVRESHVKPKRLAADKAYGNHRIRAWLKRIQANIPQAAVRKSARRA